MSLGIKEIVSRNKLRYKEDGFDLDLSYIARNIIAMGFPAETLERFYRNSINDVVKFFESKHKNQYKIYNLCSESRRRYDTNRFNRMVVEEYSFQDHNPPPFHKLKPFCESVHNWLQSDANNVAAIHCKAGKGRTGVMICVYLIFAGKCEDSQGRSVTIPNADAALEYYGRQRTRDLKGVTIPSQKRYVHYFDYLVKNSLDYRPVRLRLCSLILTSLPIYFGAGSYTLILNIFRIPKQQIKSYEIEIKKGSKFIIFNLPEELFLTGDIKFEFYVKKIKNEKLFQFCINTFFVGHDTDTYSIQTEFCQKCSNKNAGEDKLTLISNNNLKSDPQSSLLPSTQQSTLISSKSPSNVTNLKNPVIDLSFLALIKSEYQLRPCDCSSPSILSWFLSNNPKSDPYDSSLTNTAKTDYASLNPLFVPLSIRTSVTPSPCVRFTSTPTPAIIKTCHSDSKISVTTSATTTSSSSPCSSTTSSTQSLCKRIISPDCRDSNAKKFHYLILPKSNLDKAYKDKSNKLFPSNFKVILRFATVPENTDDSKSVIKSPLEVISQPTASTSNTIETCFQHCDDSESERNSSEEDDDTSDLEFTNTINIIEPNTTADCSADRTSSSIKDSDPCDRKSSETTHL
ncbi:phosphatidylinositol 345-trisphosphate 3-phosphatase and dual-specificity protein phosphatase PTEN [Sarcoptes scabiei]|nr:phosphatidylinositol 345-trisphosphate 3-phosphatase and dual-specificity protein phosphatase PTEN [Sarcoptes scabiei]